jgi:hypothetical protein
MTSTDLSGFSLSVDTGKLQQVINDLATRLQDMQMRVDELSERESMLGIEFSYGI